MNIYEKQVVLESRNFKFRAVLDEDLEDLFKVYSDKKALPFFNSDNCDGDNFYYSTKEKMKEVLGFWKMAYENRWFARLSIVEKSSINNKKRVIGTLELCLRVSEDAFNNTGIFRVDMGSEYETEQILSEIFMAVTPELPELLGCKGVITKAPIYAVDRIEAVKAAGYEKSENNLTGKNGFAYDGYWIKTY